MITRTCTIAAPRCWLHPAGHGCAIGDERVPGIVRSLAFRAVRTQAHWTWVPRQHPGAKLPGALLVMASGHMPRGARPAALDAYGGMGQGLGVTLSRCTKGGTRPSRRPARSRCLGRKRRRVATRQTRARALGDAAAPRDGGKRCGTRLAPEELEPPTSTSPLTPSNSAHRYGGERPSEWVDEQCDGTSLRRNGPFECLDRVGEPAIL